MSITDKAISTVENIINDPYFDYIVIEWDRDDVHEYVTQLEIINSKNGLFDIRLHRFNEYDDKDIYEYNDVDMQFVMEHVLKHISLVEYIQAEFSDGRQPVKMNI